MKKKLITESLRKIVTQVPDESRERRLADLDHPIVQQEDEDDTEESATGPE